ncbi:putative ferric-chelate reductase 1 isoform X1 [Osmerus eperlanus]|uniref:putative ferric-chelate reductase 1 isoform X1 n=1 Tax=Osmerus eperlanus TaxID=29151 RepID=UPI002E15F60F
MLALHLLSVVVALGMGPVSGFSNGKVSQACGDMVPVHGSESSPLPAPYNISVHTSTFGPGDNITVTLSVAISGSGYFKGFLMEAREAGNPTASPVGSFILVNPAVSQLLRCGRTQGSAVSHTSDSKKTEVQALWECPRNPPEKVQILVTVVHKYKEFWVKVPGPVLSLKGTTPEPPSPSASTTKPPTPSPLPSPFTSVGCGGSKSCLRDPVGCDPEADLHCFFLSFTPEGNTVLFELSGPAEGYMSFALSLDKWMGDDDVYLCVRDGEGVNIDAAYVSGRTHPVLAEKDVLSERAWRLSDGVIQCRFRRNVRTAQQSDGRFNLDQSFFLFLAHGRAENGAIHRHDRQPLISTNQKVLTSTPEDLIGSRSPLMIKFHGALMLVAWMFTVSTGVVVARHFRADWPERTVCGQKMWFQVHRSLMAVSVALTCAGFTLPFIYRGGWSKHAGPHPYLGSTVMALSVIQPAVAFIRPAPDSSRRYVFNWMHLGTGIAAQVLAVAAMFLGPQQQAILLPSPWPTAVLYGWVAWLVVTHLLLELLTRRSLATVHSFHYFTESEDKEILVTQVEEELRQKQATPYKKIVLAVFLLGNVTFLAVLLSTIANV